MQFKAVIFDQDGTVADHELNYEEAFKIVLARNGVNPGKHFYHQRGIGVVENWTAFKNTFDIDPEKTAEELATDTQEEFKKTLDKSKIMPGFLDFARKLKKNGIKLGLATSNSKEIVYKISKLLGLDGVFDAIVTGEEIKNKKPDPEIFLKIAQKLKVYPYECFVFEDSASGVIAAQKAGMKVGVVLRNNHDHPKFDHADLLIEDFTSVPEGFFGL
ncbi:MAG: HAD family hydrolase [Candidatus Woesebacteria bacterium GW2011_GWA1_37_8]|uniref:HAD family hydrolase n=2 Tax=Candidatus Woeseibacteriota TaxID=1752722 RepID=A0A0G0NMP3_9BACT|nr:MAG: HAD family hydrolase [Microgenomates group bacterium GW2011_GWC1_37_12b]KKQ44626.1 MAG: HAD family hydrolase [Candidatus Woesebacteria bacterium GW2011_GWA1_37_8]KKQ87149.1 MAG: HAD family hydrolase [Candidatus Woesebacteria bacterium GW2011_GWB1_38_8b]